MLKKPEQGQVVCLKSGGPAMTVESIGPSKSSPFVDCVWFNPSNKSPKRCSFHFSALVEVKAEDDAPSAEGYTFKEVVTFNR